jgi:hypothetical protein
MKRGIGAVIILVAITVGCIHKPSGPISTWERVNVDLAALGQVNNDVAKGIIAVQQTGLLTVQEAAPVLNCQGLVAKNHAALENILSAGSAEAVSRSAQIQGLLNEIKNQGTALIQSGGLGVKNPRSQQTFTQDLQALISLADVVLADYQLLGGK